MCERVDRGERHPNNRIDPCLRNKISDFNSRCKTHYQTVSSCCGHGRYPETIVVRDLRIPKRVFELHSGKEIKRQVRFYRRDDDGYYYIPEVSNPLD